MRLEDIICYGISIAITLWLTREVLIFFDHWIYMLEFAKMALIRSLFCLFTYHTSSIGFCFDSNNSDESMADSSKTFVTLLDTIKEIYNRDTDLSIHPKQTLFICVCCLL